MAAGAHRRIDSGENTGLGFCGLFDFGKGKDHAADGADTNGGDTRNGARSVEEDETAKGDGKLVESTDHRVGGGSGDADAPGGGIGDEDRGETGEDHGEDEIVTVIFREVLGYVFRGPVFDEERAAEEDGDGENVVVKHGCGKGN